MIASNCLIPRRSLAHYLAAVGLIGVTRRRSRWEAGTCRVAIDAERAARTLERRLLASRLLPTDEPGDLPVYCNRGRRSLARGVATARAWLIRMAPERRAAELAWLLGGEDQPIRLDLPPVAGTTGAWQNWNLGTLYPAAIATSQGPPALASAWLPVLVWESRRLIVSAESMSRDRSKSRVPGDYYHWTAWEWGDDLAPAQVFLLLSGGWGRWRRFARRRIPLTRHLYRLRDTSASGAMAEFCGPEPGRSKIMR